MFCVVTVTSSPLETRQHSSLTAASVTGSLYLGPLLERGGGGVREFGVGVIMSDSEMGVPVE